MNAEFEYDVLLSRSATDKPVVRPLAERLRQERLKVRFDGWVLKASDSIAVEIEERLERSRVLVLCMPANDAFGSDRAQLESGTCGRGNLPFRDPLNQERCFISLRLDGTPVKGSIAQFFFVTRQKTRSSFVLQLEQTKIHVHLRELGTVRSAHSRSKQKQK